ncbi:MAG: helix-turn-helix domain-containing protein [Cellulomonadaceae bacterium]|jgi:transcriptional regulator with XRE-family HTH domain|nr:helix-turn-helix domain-containing protein [Cellulomonadaceae bacterium]
MMTVADLERIRPVNRENVERHKERMLAEVRAWRLKEIREQAGLTQQQVADRIGVSQKQVSKIETGDISNSKITTIRSYLEAIGGKMAIEFVTGDYRLQVA